MDLLKMTFEEIVEIAPKPIQRRLEQLKFLNERPDFHPEPNTYIHTKIVTERLMLTKDKNLILAGLFHDIRKFDCVHANKKTGWPTSPGHDKKASFFILENDDIYSWIEDLGADPIEVAGICEQHIRIKVFDEMRQSKRDAMMDLPYFDKILIFTAADNMLINDEVFKRNVGE